MQKPVWNEVMSYEAAMRIRGFTQISQVFVKFSKRHLHTITTQSLVCNVLTCMLFVKLLLTRLGGSEKWKHLSHDICLVSSNCRWFLNGLLSDPCLANKMRTTWEFLFKAGWRVSSSQHLTCTWYQLYGRWTGQHTLKHWKTCSSPKEPASTQLSACHDEVMGQTAPWTYVVH